MKIFEEFGGLRRQLFHFCREGIQRSPLHFALLLLGMTLSLASWVFAQSKDNWQAPAEAKQMKNPVTSDDASLAAGKSIYADRCVQCHGEKGDGNGDQADMYSPPPSDFTKASRMNAQTDGELFWKITEGRRPMPGFKGRLSDEDRWKLVNYLRTFVPKPLPASPKDAEPKKKKGSTGRVF